MQNRIEKYKEIKKVKFSEALDKKLAEELARADDDEFAAAKINAGAPSVDQDSTSWSDLWQRLKNKGSRVFGQK